jgi:uncharacterized membrane-anchored protein YhcB (DUF1043 family)
MLTVRFILSISTIFIICFIVIYYENVQSQMSNQTEFDKQLKMQEQELDQQLKENAESFNETEKLEALGR